MIIQCESCSKKFVVKDADIPNEILKKLLKKNIISTFNSITCDSDTSTNDMVTIFSTGKAKHSKIRSINDEKIFEFDKEFLLLIFVKHVIAIVEGIANSIIF